MIRSPFSLQAMMIEFTKPLTTTPVQIPKGGVFCIADSGARLNKASTPDYNTRVSQCREAALVRKPFITLFIVIFYIFFGQNSSLKADNKYVL